MGWGAKYMRDINVRKEGAIKTLKKGVKSRLCLC